MSQTTMSAANETTPEGQAGPTGLTLPCPCCQELLASVAVHLADPDTFTCFECNEEFSRQTVEEWIEGMKKWGRILFWVDSMPTE